MQARDVILVMLYGIQRHGKRQVRQLGMDAILLIDRHLILFQIEIGDALLQHANQQVVRKLILVGKTRRRDSFKPPQKRLIRLVPLRQPIQRIVVQLVVVAVIPKRSRPLRQKTQIRFVLLLENYILRGNPLSNRLRIFILKSA